MKVAMGVLAVLAIVGGFLQIPGVDDGDPQVPRADVRRLAALRDARAVGTGTQWLGLVDRRA